MYVLPDGWLASPVRTLIMSGQSSPQPSHPERTISEPVITSLRQYRRFPISRSSVEVGEDYLPHPGLHPWGTSPRGPPHLITIYPGLPRGPNHHFHRSLHPDRGPLSFPASCHTPLLAHS